MAKLIQRFKAKTTNSNLTVMLDVEVSNLHKWSPEQEAEHQLSFLRPVWGDDLAVTEIVFLWQGLID